MTETDLWMELKALVEASENATRKIPSAKACAKLAAAIVRARGAMALHAMPAHHEKPHLTTE